MSKYQFKHPRVFVGQLQYSIGQYAMPANEITLGNWTENWINFFRVDNESHFHMILRVLDHECLHAILNQFVGDRESEELDNLYGKGAIFWKIPF